MIHDRPGAGSQSAAAGSASPARARVRREQLNPTCRSARFAKPGGCEEVWLFLTPDLDGSFQDQLDRTVACYHEALAAAGLSRESAVFRRVFVSDATHQLEAVMASPLGHGGTGADGLDGRGANPVTPRPGVLFCRPVRVVFPYRIPHSWPRSACRNAPDE